jgi:NDP-4-keto-2,6-dideoxyhexose 3-C-methyltransferase
MAYFKEISYCRLCRGKKLEQVIDLGFQALSGCFPKKDEPHPPKAPLEVTRCLDCDLVQLRHSVTPQLMFTDSYGYRSNINYTMRTHLKELAKSICKKVVIKEEDIVLDIGCNDGTLLKEYSPSLKRLGVDPIADKFHSQYPEGVKVISDFFSREKFQEFNLGKKKVKIITCISMFYDLEDPVQFASDVAACLDEQGIWVIEQSYLPDMLKNSSFDTICHEHLEYYSLKQIENIVNKVGLRVFDLEFNRINGGSMCAYVTPIHSSLRDNVKILEDTRQAESKLELSSQSTYLAFKKNCERLAVNIKEFVKNEISKNKVIHVYGASTKGNTILQFCDLNFPILQAAADRNPEKWGCRTPITNIPIISEEESRQRRPDYYLVLPWHFKEEIIIREKEFLKKGGGLVFTMPELDIIKHY